MNSKDWTGKTWELKFNEASVQELLVPPGPKKNQFRLRATRSNGKVVYFRLEYKRGAMARCWKHCILFPRGDTLAPQPTTPLPEKPTQKQDETFRDELKRHLDQFPFTTKRLEGDVKLPTDGLGSVQLIQVPKALGGKQAFLMVVFAFETANPGGSAGGGSVRT